MPNFIFILFIITSVIKAQQFTKMENQPPVIDGGDSRGVNWIDYDNDGDLDLFITNGPKTGENNFLYKNEDGAFIKIEDVIITQDFKPSDGSTWGDYDNDGDPDLFVGNWWGYNNLLYSNNNNGSFSLAVEKPSTETSYSETGNWGDFNNDGFLDLFVSNSGGDKKNFLYLNNGDGRFTKITEGDIVNDAFESRSADWIDYDDDGDLDLFVANENNTKNNLYQNNGVGSFKKIGDLPMLLSNSTSFSSSWADYDNDGDFDLFIANYNNQQNELYSNEGNGAFLGIFGPNVTIERSYSISSEWGDVDNDGDLDLFVANAFSGSSVTNNFFYLNNGDGTFTTDTSLLTQNNGWTYSGEFGDFNNDGFLDLATANCFDASENNSIYVNNGGTNRWLKINLEGSISNKSAIGSVIKIVANISGNDAIQLRRVTGQSSYCTQNMQVHFGVGILSVLDSVIVNWPSGQKSILTNVPTNQTLKITEPIPENYISVNFKADIIRGPDHTSVKFTDLSVSDPNNPITSWFWDFDNDGYKDSDLQNTEYTYAAQADTNFTVRLLVSNGTNSSEKIRENYINITGVTSTEDFNIPNDFILNQNYPNPFNPVTTISFIVPLVEGALNTSSTVILKVYDVLGNEIATLLNEEKPPGNYSISFNGENLSSGSYFYTLQYNNEIQTRKMLLIK